MKKELLKTISILLTFLIIISIVGCGREKNITVIVREESSGTREAFDKAIKNKDTNLEGNITKEAIIYNKTGLVLSAVASDKSSIGYISLSSANDSVKIIKVNGVYPSKEKVISKQYPIQRPFVILTTEKAPLTLRAEDFLNYLKSEASNENCNKAGTIYLSDKSQRANEGKEPIPELVYNKLPNLPNGEKIIIRGSTSMEKFISASAKDYADIYGVAVEEIFDIELQGSSVGISAVENDKSGNVIGLSSVEVSKEGVESFNVCLDVVAVIVNKNTDIDNFTMEQLYDIFTGEMKSFSQMTK